MKRIVTTASMLFALVLGAAQATPPPPGASPLPLTNANFDLDSVGNHWLNGTGSTTIGLFADSRHLSPPNVFGASNLGGTQSRLQRIAFDHTGEPVDDLTAIANTRLQYEGNHVYAFSIHSFAGGDGNATFKLQFLGNPSATGGNSGNTVVAEQTFLAGTGGPILAPDGITHWEEFTLVFATSNNPSALGQYISVQIITTTGADAGHDAGFPNFDNAGGWMVPEPGAVVLLGLGSVVLLWRRRR